MKDKYWGRKEWFDAFIQQGHEPVEDEWGINIFAYEGGEYCNGPACRKCGWDLCWHCHPEISYIPKCEAS